MILVTTGSQMPFDRLVRAVDDWAGETGAGEIFAQIGQTAFKPVHIQWVSFLTPEEFRERLERAEVVVAHAGMGTVLTALELGKPVLVMPRQAALRETRNDHQVATARLLKSEKRVDVAMDERELVKKLGDLDSLRGTERIGKYASATLIEKVRSFIQTGR